MCFTNFTYDTTPPGFIFVFYSSFTGELICFDQCTDSKERQYQPQDIVQALSSLNFIRNGMNVCIFGASDSGKTYLAKALGAEACREFRVGYYHCEDLASELAAVRKSDYKRY